MPSRAWIATGSNLGDRESHLAAARAGIAAAGKVVVASEIDETVPLGGLEQPSYLNQMLIVETALSPDAVMKVCHEIERSRGRERTSRWCSRTLDLDLVRYDDLLCDTPDLTLPHPGLRDRSFWAREIAQLEAHG
ncbi:MAG: 2-amino-4-hydroxy-6-hydroxymethyldihydropteridine diphosphokinase [Gemmatimonadales bacterium]